MASQAELTPCGAMFDIFKRAAHLSHIELCGLVLSSRPLADGRSPQSRAADRSWVSRFIVRAPVGTLQERYFADYGTSAARIMSQLALRRRNPMDAAAVTNNGVRPHWRAHGAGTRGMPSGHESLSQCARAPVAGG